jgi:hypothetical protein
MNASLTEYIPQTRSEIIAEMSRVLRVLGVVMKTAIWDRSGLWVTAAFEFDDQEIDISLAWDGDEGAIEIRLEEGKTPPVLYLYPWEGDDRTAESLYDRIEQKRKEMWA